MPDHGKMQKAREVGLRIARSCATCTHFTGFPDGGRAWACCDRRDHRYIHAKHGNSAGIANVALVCDDWSEDPGMALSTGLGQYVELLRR